MSQPLLTLVATACALAFSPLAHSRPVTLTAQLKNYGGDGAYLAAYLMDAKGYAVDRMAHVLQEHCVRHALAALDGELRAVGGQSGGLPWSVALESPEIERRAVRGVIELEDLAVATSGD
jgi:hypothetical protein